MELIEIILNYSGGVIEAQIQPEENYNGILYPVSLNGIYAFTICFNNDEKWSIMREDNGIIPVVEEGLLKIIYYHLRWELSHAA